MKKIQKLAPVIDISQKIPESPKQRVLETYPGSGYLRSKDGVV